MILSCDASLNEEFVISSVKETEMCHYQIEASSPLACPPYSTIITSSPTPAPQESQSIEVEATGPTDLEQEPIPDERYQDDDYVEEDPYVESLNEEDDPSGRTWFAT